MWLKRRSHLLLVRILSELVFVENKGYVDLSKKLKIELPYELPEIPILGISPKKTKTSIHKDISHLMFIAALFTRAKI